MMRQAQCVVGTFSTCAVPMFDTLTGTHTSAYAHAHAHTRAHVREKMIQMLNSETKRLSAGTSSMEAMLLENRAAKGAYKVEGRRVGVSEGMLLGGKLRAW